MKNAKKKVLVFGGGSALVAFLLSSCVLEPQAGRRAASQDSVEKAVLDAGDEALKKPEARFLIKDGLYAVPIAVDGDGCEQYTTWSEFGARSLTQPIYFLDDQGSFSPTKTDASCKAKMIKTGVDETGCPTFRTEQPDGTSSDVTYYPASNGHTVRRERAACG